MKGDSSCRLSNGYVLVSLGIEGILRPETRRVTKQFVYGRLALLVTGCQNT